PASDPERLDLPAQRLESLANLGGVPKVPLVFLSQDHDRRLGGEIARPHRFDVRDDAREVPGSMELLVALRVESGQIDADVAEAARLLEAPGALRTEVGGVRQNRDRQAAIEERAASLLEERIDRRLVVVGEKDDDIPA